MADPDGDLERLLDEARADEAADARARERWLRRQAQEEATVAGVVLDLAESDRAVVATTTAGRSHAGRVVLVGDDCVVLRDEAGRDTYLRMAALATVEPQPGSAGAPAATGERPPPSTARLLDLLGELAAERPDVQVWLVGVAHGLTGRLVAVGQDVLTLRLAGDDERTSFVAAQSVAAVSLFVSG